MILSAEGIEFVFICAETASRSAWVIRLPAAIAEVAEVAVVINVLREMPEDLSDIIGLSLRYALSTQIVAYSRISSSLMELLGMERMRQTARIETVGFTVAGGQETKTEILDE